VTCSVEDAVGSDVIEMYEESFGDFAVLGGVVRGNVEGCSSSSVGGSPPQWLQSAMDFLAGGELLHINYV
jgi:hypothetical protein